MSLNLSLILWPHNIPFHKYPVPGSVLHLGSFQSCASEVTQSQTPLYTPRSHPTAHIPKRGTARSQAMCIRCFDILADRLWGGHAGQHTCSWLFSSPMYRCANSTSHRVIFKDGDTFWLIHFSIVAPALGGWSPVDSQLPGYS